MPAPRVGQGLGKRKRATIQVKIILTWVISKNTKTNDGKEMGEWKALARTEFAFVHIFICDSLRAKLMISQL